MISFMYLNVQPIPLGLLSSSGLQKTYVSSKIVYKSRPFGSFRSPSLHPKPYLYHKPTYIHPTMASSATSLHFLSFAPQTTLSPSKPNATIHFNSLSIPSAPSSKLGLSVAYSISHREEPLFSGSRFVLFTRRVAVSSDYDQIGLLDEEEVASDDASSYEEEEPSFSPDQKLFVGNLPFSVDSAALAHLFARAGNVEMVEVFTTPFLSPISLISFSGNQSLNSLFPFSLFSAKIGFLKLFSGFACLGAKVGVLNICLGLCILILYLFFSYIVQAIEVFIISVHILSLRRDIPPELSGVILVYLCILRWLNCRLSMTKTVEEAEGLALSLCPQPRKLLQLRSSSMDM